MEGLLSIIIPSYNEGLLIDNTANVVVSVKQKSIKTYKKRQT